VAGHSGVMAERAGFRLPIESVALQALVSEPIKPCMDVVVMANTVHGYMSQSDKGEMVIGGGADGFNNYTQRGSVPPCRGNRARAGRDLPDHLAASRCCAGGAGSST
jgi:glycine/D-amino acid oxidase-like deaminating enzyme